MPKTFGFSKRERISSSFEIRTVRSKGRKILSNPIAVYKLPNQLGYPRMAIALTRKSGISALRNRVRRMVREFFRTHKVALGQNDYFFFASWNLKLVSKQQWTIFFERLGICENKRV